LQTAIKMNTLVSVVVPAYNCSRFIESAIESVLAQTYKSYELIVVDDGSTDNTAEIIRKYQNKLNYIYQENGGVSKARNAGIMSSKGAYIAFLDADDAWEKNKLEIQMEAMRKFTDVDFVYCGFRHTKNGKMVHNRTYEDTFNIFKEYNCKIENIFEYHSVFELNGKTIRFHWGNIYKHLFLGNFILPSSVLFKKESLNKVGLLNEEFRVAEETEFFLKFSKFNKIGFIEIPLLFYEIPESDNLSGKKNTEKLIKAALKIQIDSLMTNHDYYQENSLYFDKGISTTYCRLAYYYLSEYRLAESRKYAVFGLRTCKWNIPAYKILLAGLIPRQFLEYLVYMKRWRKKNSEY